jgi:hypothetical protein
MPDGNSALSRLNRTPTRINEEAERGLLGPDTEPETEPQLTTGSPAPVAVVSKPRRAGKQSGFENLTAALQPKVEPVPFSVRLPPWLRQAVVERIKTMQGKGIKITQDQVAKQALMAYFDLEEPQ